MARVMRDFVNELNWSYSRKNAFERCKRLYYYQYYLFWNGWRHDAPYVQRHTYRLKKMRSFATFAGEVVHGQIKRALEHWRDSGTAMPAEECIRQARRRWDQAIEESQSLRWLTDPKHFCCFLEDYYCEDSRQEKMEKAWECVETCLENFCTSKTWGQLRASRCDYWLSLDSEEFVPVLVDGIPLFGKPDLAYGYYRNGETKGMCRIFDWKTGKARDGDARQLRYYALFAHIKWGFPIENIKARLVYLNPLGDEDDIDLTPLKLETARQEMRESFESMLTMLQDQSKNTPLDMAKFPTTKSLSVCPYCSFQEICPDRSALVQTLTGHQNKA